MTVEGLTGLRQRSRGRESRSNPGSHVEALAEAVNRIWYRLGISPFKIRLLVGMPEGLGEMEENTKNTVDCANPSTPVIVF